MTSGQRQGGQGQGGVFSSISRTFLELRSSYVMLCSDGPVLNKIAGKLGTFVLLFQRL